MVCRVNNAGRLTFLAMEVIVSIANQELNLPDRPCRRCADRSMTNLCVDIPKRRELRPKDATRSVATPSHTLREISIQPAAIIETSTTDPSFPFQSTIHTSHSVNANPFSQSFSTQHNLPHLMNEEESRDRDVAEVLHKLSSPVSTETASSSPPPSRPPMFYEIDNYPYRNVSLEERRDCMKRAADL
jgi:hypothetical protein